MTERPGTKYQQRAAAVVATYHSCFTQTAAQEYPRLVNLIAKAIADAEAPWKTDATACQEARIRDALEAGEQVDRIAELEGELATWEPPEGHVWVKVHIDDVASLRAIQRIRDADGTPMYGPQPLDQQETRIRELEAKLEELARKESRYHQYWVIAEDAKSQMETRISELEQRDIEAATYVETVICMRTGFTGDPPYVGWRGLGLALTERLDELEIDAEVLRAKIRKLTERVISQTAPPVLETDTQESL